MYLKFGLPDTSAALAQALIPSSGTDPSMIARPLAPIARRIAVVHHRLSISAGDGNIDRATINHALLELHSVARLKFRGFRLAANRRHRLIDILIIALLAVICGGRHHRPGPSPQNNPSPIRSSPNNPSQTLSPK